MKKDPRMDFDPSIYSVRTWKSPVLLFWLLNPFMVITELLQGLRIPRVTLIGKGEGGTLKGMVYVPCPHCGTIHSGLEWSKRNRTRDSNWFGLYCKDCGNIIPCLYCVASYVVLGLTFPIWYRFKDRWKARWLEKQRIRFAKPLDLELPEFTWWKVGLRWGAWMYLFTAVVFPWITGEAITAHKLLIGVPFWAIAGLVLALFLKYFAVPRKGPVPISASPPGEP